jgi:hypothetical protein
MKKYLVITADTNDGDYVTEKHLVTDETLESLKPAIEAVKNFKPYTVRKFEIDWTHNHNFPTGECCREDLGEKSPKEYYVGGGFLTEDQFLDFEELVPYAEYGIHTIKTVEILNVSEETKLL